MKAATSLLAFSVMLASCSDPKAASKGNFETVINAWVEKHPPCIDVPWGDAQEGNGSRMDFPRYKESTPVKVAFLEENRKKQTETFDALVEAGLLKSSATQITQKVAFGDDRKVAVTAYDLTDKGKAALETDAKGTPLSGAQTAFCYGKPHVDEVTQFTEPGEMMGMKISQVTYRYHLADLPDWAKSARVKAAFPKIARDTADSLDGKAAVVLTGDGWKHEKEI
ncbi:MAG: hypothetical protein EOP67_11945 [Sphingomonas sp.]|jgi:hypothetical protein|nr:MAG: hypothetical protein EOP67_11945 [Sphingomonas sp.]